MFSRDGERLHEPELLAVLRDEREPRPDPLCTVAARSSLPAMCTVPDAVGCIPNRHSISSVLPAPISP